MKQGASVSGVIATLLDKAGSGATELTIPDKHLVYSPGQEADSAYCVMEGQIKLAVFSETGRDAVIGLCGPGQFFGEGCLIGDTPVRFSDATAIGPTRIVRLEKSYLTRLLREDKDFASAFLLNLIGRTRRLEDDLIDHFFNSTEKRLARILLLLADFGADEEPATPIPALSQATLAQMVGASRPRVSEFLNKFRQLGFIEYNGEIRVRRSLLQVVLKE